VDSVEISSDKGMKIRISKSPQQRGAMQIPTPVPVPAIISAPAPTAVSTPTPTEAMPAYRPESEAKAEASRAKLLEVKSPMVGTFYGSPEPGSKPYVAEGARVAKGQVLCIIEAMKIMNEIESEYDGVVREVVADNGHPVEYGQVLFRIDPTG
jgi:acetyl-CoA carboxylase biotin carboxyl carrier protein